MFPHAFNVAAINGLVIVSLMRNEVLIEDNLGIPQKYIIRRSHCITPAPQSMTYQV